MNYNTVYVGMDVHKESFTFCAYTIDAEKGAHFQKTSSDYKSVLKYLDFLRTVYGDDASFVCGYEAGCLGFSLYHQLTERHVKCIILAPTTMLEQRSRKRVKTDKRDAWYHDIDVDFAGLRNQNEDIVGWIYFEDEESISYPLLYSGDDYYLRRNYLKEEETAGSIYIDGNNSPDLDDSHTLIYGHNMRNLSMFGNLKFYKTEEDYFENHRYFQLITESGAYRYEIFAYKDVSSLTGGIYTTWKYVDDDFKKFVEDSICQGSYVDADIDVDDETHIVTLSTCSYDSDVRFTVSAVRVDEHEWK